MLPPSGPAADVSGPVRFMRTAMPPPSICAQPYLNDDSHRQGGHWPGDTVNGKTRKKYRSVEPCVCVCVCVCVCARASVYGHGREWESEQGVYVMLLCGAHHL